MRDNTILSNMESTHKRITIIYRQMVFIDTRLQAFEAVSRKPWFLIKALFWPSEFIRKVNNLQMELLKQHDEDMKKQSEEQKAKPKITLISPNGRG